MTKSVGIDLEGGLEARLLDDQGLLAMISFYGVSILPEIVMDRSALTMQYQTRTPSGALMTRIARNTQWSRVLSESGNPAHPVSSRFNGLDLYWANPITLNPPRGIEADFLFTSTPEAWTIREPFFTNPELPRLFERDIAETRGVQMLGASLSGVFPSWFAGRPRPLREDGEELPDMPTTAKPARILVVGETEFATGFMNVTNGQRNLDFLVQAADWLSNDDDIIGIRSRESSSGRLEKIFDAEQRSAAMRFVQIINVFVVPALVICAGILLAIRRRRKAQTKTKNLTKEHSDDI
jgi:ABC-type uncharacterized transport system involved in gliding motility auxiliary subunit